MTTYPRLLIQIFGPVFVIAALAPLHAQSDFSGGCPYCNGGGMFGDIAPTAGISADVAPPSSGTAKSSTAATPNSTSNGTAKVPTADQANAPARFPELKQGSDGYWRIGFEHLASFDFIPPVEGAPPKPDSVALIPSKVQALDGKRVRLTGFMLPTKFEGGSVREFLLLRSMMACCYGIMPQPNEWVVVKMKGDGTAPVMNVPLNFYGTLHVGELYDGNGFAGLYQLDGEKMSDN